MLGGPISRKELRFSFGVYHELGALVLMFTIKGLGIDIAQ